MFLPPSLVSFLLLLPPPTTYALSLFFSSSSATTRRDAIFGGPAAAAAAAAASSTFLVASASEAATAGSGAAPDLSEYRDGPRGIKHLVVKEGSVGATKPTRGGKVKASYDLYLNGFPDFYTTGRVDSDKPRLIDSSKNLWGTDDPLEFVAGIGRVVKGLDLEVLDMVVGERRRVVVPPELGYGDEDVGGGKIPAGSALYFEVELVEVGDAPNMGPEQVKWLEEHPL